MITGVPLMLLNYIQLVGVVQIIGNYKHLKVEREREKERDYFEYFLNLRTPVGRMEQISQRH